MNIVRIFALTEGSLYTVQFDNEPEHEWSRLFEAWNDITFLEDFFEKHKADLIAGFFGNIDIETAILITMEESGTLEKTILELSLKGKKNKYGALQTFFKSLDDKSTGIIPLNKEKAYGSRKKSWLRIYAIRIASNTYVISGGAIKLTKTMNEREHLRAELDKLEKTKQYLINEGLLDENDFDFLELTQ